MTLTIAIDGTSGSGKGTLARKLAAHYDFPCLHTGLLYRAVAKAVIDKGGNGTDKALALELIGGIDFSTLDEATLHQGVIGEVASLLAAEPALRKKLVTYQRAFATKAKAGAIVEGRDIGTVILPQAQVKFFLDADIAVRAQRRYQQLKALKDMGGEQVSLDLIHAELEERDQRDKNRPTAPLKKADDAHLLNTSNQSIVEITNQAIHLINTAQQ